MCDYTRPGVNDWWNNPKPGQLAAAEKLLDELEEEGLEFNHGD